MMKAEMASEITKSRSQTESMGKILGTGGDAASADCAGTGAGEISESAICF